MRDRTLKRWLHFPFGFVVGAFLGALLVGRLALRWDWGDAQDPYTLPLVLGALAGGLLVGAAAAWKLDAFWEWWSHR